MCGKRQIHIPIFAIDNHIFINIAVTKSLQNLSPMSALGEIGQWTQKLLNNGWKWYKKDRQAVISVTLRASAKKKKKKQQA